MNESKIRSLQLSASEAPPRSRIDLNLFRVFDAVIRLGSLTRAAEELHLTQPAVSNALTRLRQHFDDPLFRRGGGKMAPTPLAQDIAGDVAQALNSLRGSVLRGQRFDPATSSRRFTIGMRDSLEFTLLPPLCRLIGKHAPGLRLSSVQFDREHLSRQLTSGDLSMAIDIAQPVGAGVRQQPLFENSLCVMLRNGHRLSQRNLSLADWLAASHVTVSARPSGAVLEDAALARRGLSRNVALRCQHYYAACHVVASSDLLLTLPRNYATWFGRHLPVTVLPTPLPLPSLKLFLFWHQGMGGDEGHAWMRSQVLELLEARLDASPGKKIASKKTMSTIEKNRK